MRNSRPIPKELPDLRVATAPDEDIFAEATPAGPPPIDHAEGDVIADKYRLVRRIGAGGMGEVWIAHNEALAVKVAIKLIGASYREKSYVTRLAQEAQAAASLGHPAIIRVFDFGKTEAGAPYIVMELLHGEDLSSVLDRRGAISEVKAVQTLLPVIHALAAAHDKGIVHRDLKPANIFLARMDPGGVQPKLLDFGISKSDRSNFKRVTNAGVLVGSPAYMSPEQARGEDVDRSADLWAMGVVLYELITGMLPFNGENYNGLLWAIAHDEPIPTTTQFGGDAKLWAILARGFRKQRAGRWESMRDLGEALAKWLHDQGVREDIAGSSLQTAWFDRTSGDPELFETDPLRPSDGATGLARARGLRGEDAIPTLPGSFSSGAPELPGMRRQVWLRRLAAVAALATVGVLGFWLTRPASRSEGPRTNASSTAATIHPPTHGVPAPVIAPVEDDSVTVPSADVPRTAADEQNAAVGATSGRPQRPRSTSRSAAKAQSWEKLKNPFD